MSDMQNMMSEQVCIKCAWGMPMKCMSKACLSTIGSKCVKHTTKDQNMINKFNHGNPQSLELIGVQNNIKMPFEHFIKHLIYTNKTNMWAMHEHEWKLPKYMLKCYKGPSPLTCASCATPYYQTKKIILFTCSPWHSYRPRCGYSLLLSHMACT